MREYLLDTSSLSLLAPGRDISPDTIRAVRRHSNTLHLPTIAVAEILGGVHELRRQGADRRADALDAWLSRLTTNFSMRVLPFDLEAAQVAGAMSDAAIANGRHPGFADLAIAAIAASRKLVVLTENRRHFEALGAETVPLSELR